MATGYLFRWLLFSALRQPPVLPYSRGCHAAPVAEDLGEERAAETVLRVGVTAWKNSLQNPRL